MPEMQEHRLGKNHRAVLRQDGEQDARLLIAAFRKRVFQGAAQPTGAVRLFLNERATIPA
jgi:hypothetical protein